MTRSSVKASIEDILGVPESVVRAGVGRQESWIATASSPGIIGADIVRRGS